MRLAQFYATAIFVIGRLYPVRGGVEVMGQTASLLAKAAPALPHHSSIGSLSLPMTIFLEIWLSVWCPLRAADLPQRSSRNVKIFSFQPPLRIDSFRVRRMLVGNDARMRRVGK